MVSWPCCYKPCKTKAEEHHVLLARTVFHPSIQFICFLIEFKTPIALMATTVKDLVRKHADIYSILTASDQREVDKLAEVIKRFSKDQAWQLVAAAGGHPVLCSYSNDGTPLMAKQRFVTKVGPATIVRQGGDDQELLVQRAIFQYVDSAGCHIAGQFAAPMPLTKGKTGAAIFAASLAFVKTIRQMGHRGIAVQHYVFDRAIHSYLYRRFRQQHSALAKEDAAAQRKGCIHDPALLEWVVDTPCCNHDCHNALRWSLKDYMADESLLTDVWATVESLRNGFTFLIAELPRFVATRIKFVDGDSDEAHRPADATSLWAVLGAEPEWVEAIVDLGLRYHKGHLLVDARHRDDRSVFGKIGSIIMYSMRFVKFSDSRWCTLGRCCRVLAFASRLGVGDLALSVLDDPNVTLDYRLRGFRKFQGKVKYFVALAAMCSHPCDVLLSELMADDRLLLHADKYQESVRAEMQGMLAVPDVVWDEVAAMCDGVSGPALRAAVLSATHVSLGFIDTQVWSRLRILPWKLATGDIAANLEELSKMESPPMESVTRKVWALLGQGFSREQLMAGLSLLRHLGWSSATVEQQHASATLVHRQHKQYGMARICSRALVHTARMLFDAPSATLVDRLQAKAQRAAAMTSLSFKLSAQQLYIKKALERHTERHSEMDDATGDASRRWARRKGVFARASQRYTTLPPQFLGLLRDLASEETERRAQRASAELFETTERLQEARLQQRADASEALPQMLTFASCKYSAAQQAELDSMYRADGMWERGQVVALRKAALVAPPPLSEEREAVLDAQILVEPPKPPQPWWLSCVCNCRSAFKDTALRVGDGDDARYYRFLFAKQKPLTAAFCPLKAEEQDMYTPLVDFEAFDGVDIFSELQEWKHMFSCDRTAVLQAHEIGGEEGVRMHVLVGLVDRGSAHLVSDGPEFELPEFVAGLPQLDRKPPRQRKETKGKSSAGASRAAATPQEAFLAANPWMASKPMAKKAKVDTFGHAGPRGSSDPSEGESSSGSESWDPMYDSDDDRADEVHTELQKLRDAWCAKHGAAGQDDFGGGLLGGSFTKREFGLVADYVCCEAITPDARAFVKLYGLTASRRCKVELYGEATATALAQGWAHKMQYYLDVHRASLDEAYVFIDTDHTAYREPASFIKAVDDCHVKEVMTVAASIRKIRPTVPVK